MTETDPTRVLDAETVTGLHLHGVDVAEVERRIGSRLASVLADDATVEVVARALWLAEDYDLDADPNSRTAREMRPGFMTQARVALAALSAHLAAPGPAGDPSGEDGL